MQGNFTNGVIITCKNTQDNIIVYGIITICAIQGIKDLGYLTIKPGQAILDAGEALDATPPTARGRGQHITKEAKK